MLTENKFSKYLIYAIGEIVLVVIGILIALYINNLNEISKERTAEKKAFISINQDLKNESYELSRHKQLSLDAIAYLEPIANNNFKNIDSLDYYLNISYRFVKNNPTYEGLKNTNSLEIFENEDTRRLLRYFYDTIYDGLRNMANSHNNFIETQSKPFIINNIPANPSEIDTMTFSNSIKFNNIVNYQIKYFKNNLKSFETVDSVLNHLIQSTQEK